MAEEYWELVPRKRIVVIVLVSTQFQEDIKMWAWEQTKKGYLVLFAPFAKEENPEVEPYREELELQHYQKIDMADLVFVFNKNGHIGTHTTREIDYAKAHSKIILYLEHTNQLPDTHRIKIETMDTDGSSGTWEKTTIF